MQCFNKISCTYLIKLLIKIENVFFYGLFEILVHVIVNTHRKPILKVKPAY